jgi:phosphatidylinositol glycan class B
MQPKPQTPNPNPNPKPQTQYFTFLCALSIILFAATAILSVGYLQADEHYQIIEFAQFKRNKTDILNLTWEFHDRIRSTFLPSLATLVFNACDAIGLTNGFSQAFTLRLLSAGASLLVLWRWLKSNPVQNRPMALFYSTLLCFIPYLSVRFSSEVWSGLFICLISIIYKDYEKKSNDFWLGVLGGFAFLCRFQCGILLLILLVHMVTIKKVRGISILKFILGFLLVASLGILLDSWFYGTWTISAWNYTMAFIFPRNPSAFSENNWDFYLNYFISLHGFVIAPAILIAWIVTIIKEPKNILSWWFIGFIAFHQCIGHKEFRFLIPLAFLIPEVIGRFFRHIKLPERSLIIHLIMLALLCINLYAIPFFCFRPAGIGRIAIIQYFNELRGERPLKINCTPYSDPINPWGGYGNSFYQLPGVSLNHLENLDLWKPHHSKDSLEFLIVSNQEWKTERYRSKILNSGFEKVTQSIPPWVLSSNSHLNWFDNNAILIVLKHK